MADLPSLLAQARGGKVYDAAYGRRFTGTGPYADLLDQRMRVAMTRLGYPPERLRLRAAEDAVRPRLLADGPLHVAVASAADDLRVMLGGDGFAFVQGRRIDRHGVCPPTEDVLALARWVVEQHAGTIALAAGADGRGARVRLELPAVDHVADLDSHPNQKDDAA